MAGAYLWIVSLMFFGAWLLYCRKKRKFNRLNEFGIEVFDSYPDKVKADTFDTLLLWVGAASLISSVFMLMMADYTAMGWLTFFIVAVFLIRRSRNRRK